MKRLWRPLEYCLVRALLALLGLLGRSRALKVGEWCGRLYYRLDARHRRVARRNLEIAFPHWSEERREETVRRTFAQLGRSLAEFAFLPRWNRDTVPLDLEGMENLERALERGKGALIVTAHFGMWELLAFGSSLMGRPVALVARRMSNRRLDRYINRVRSRHGNKVIYKHEAAGGIMRALRDKRVVGVLMDQNDSHGVFVDFFGLPAATSTGVAVLARRTGAPVLPSFVLYDEASGRHRIVVGEEIPLADNDDGDGPRRDTSRFMKVVEDMARRHPEQYFWLHRRWKTRPPGEKRFY